MNNLLFLTGVISGFLMCALMHKMQKKTSGNHMVDCLKNHTQYTENTAEKSDVAPTNENVSAEELKKVITAFNVENYGTDIPQMEVK